MVDQSNYHSVTDEALLAAAENHLRLNQARLQSGLMARLRASVSAHRQYTTVRREDHRWFSVAPGLQAQGLRESEDFQVCLWRLESGARLRWPVGALALEVLVIEGGLIDETGTPLQAAQDYAYLLCHEPAQWNQWTASGSTTLYIRTRRAPLHKLSSLEAHWWQLACAQSGTAPRRRWARTTPGVEVMGLCGDKQVVSMLVRFEAGACVSDHHHAIDEDCLLLQGEMFLGDILLRAGDYQLAPASGTHFGETSDVGVTFFFHGALDPVLLQPAPKAE
jgi:hypothetical protein